METAAKIPPIDLSAPNNIKTFTCGMGCFWGPDSKFGIMDGVVRTRVGYAGGTTENPTYRNLGDHIETIQIDYDPEKLTFEKLLEIFWNGHKPTRTVWKRQYTSALFFQTESEGELAKETRNRISSELDEKVHTEIIPLERFYLAEMYHQKYHLQGYEELISEYRTIYPNFTDILNSTSAARVNGYIGGYGDSAKFENEFPILGLSEDKGAFLRKIINGNKRY